MSPSSRAGGPPDTLKRSRDPVYEPPVKKNRVNNERFSENSRPGNYISPSRVAAAGERSPLADAGVREARRAKWPPPRPPSSACNDDKRSPPKVGSSLSSEAETANGHHSPSCTSSASPPSQTDASTGRTPDSASLSNGLPSHHADADADASRSTFTSSRNDQKTSSSNYRHRNENGVHRNVQSSSSSSSPDSQQENNDFINYKE